MAHEAQTRYRATPKGKAKTAEYNKRVADARRASGSSAAHWRKIKYGLTEAEYQAILEKQEGKCAICLEEKPLHVDHCHETKKVRGLLCMLCNTALGKFRDDPDRLARALKYVCN